MEQKITELTARITNTIQYFTKLIANRMYPIFAKASKTLIGKLPSKREHVHPEYVNRNEPAPLTKALNKKSDFAPKKHVHAEYVPNAGLVSNNNTQAKHIETAQTLNSFSRNQFSLKSHSHSYVKKYYPLGKQYAIATSAKVYAVANNFTLPSAYFATKIHDHSQRYVKKGQRVNFTKQLRSGPFYYSIDRQGSFILAVKKHTHPENDIKPNVKLKLWEIDATENISNFRATLYVENLQPSQQIVRTLNMNLQNLISEKFIPRALKPTKLLTTFDAYFHLYAKDAFSSYNSFSTLSSSYTNVSFQYIYPSIIMNIINQMLGQSTIQNTAVTVKVPISKYHFGYFVQLKQIPLLKDVVPKFVFASPIAKAYTNAASDIASIANSFNEHYLNSIALLRAQLGLNPIERLPKDVNSLFAFGVGSKTRGEIKLYTGGFFATTLVFYTVKQNIL